MKVKVDLCRRPCVLFAQAAKLPTAVSDRTAAAAVRSVALIAVCVAIAQSPAATAASSQWRQLELPAAVEVREDLRGAPDGWRSSVDDRPHILASITFFDGRPEDKASLVYDAEVKRKGTVVRSWRFYSDWKNGAWVQLGYAGTAVMLAKQLPKDTVECRVEFDRNVSVDGYERIRSVECR